MDTDGLLDGLIDPLEELDREIDDLMDPLKELDRRINFDTVSIDETKEEMKRKRAAVSFLLMDIGSKSKYYDTDNLSNTHI